MPGVKPVPDLIPGRSNGNAGDPSVHLGSSGFDGGERHRCLGVAVAPVAQAGTQKSFVGGFNTVTTVASTVPGNGDVNPYGVAVVKDSLGKLRQGNVLVSNFNNSQNHVNNL